jgi:D-methionine transport system ATP-binding protein
MKIPEGILGDIEGKLVRVLYRGTSALNPILSNAIRKYPVDMNILHGRIEYINNQPMGVLLVNINGENNDVVNLIHYLKENTATAEVIHD